MKHKRFAITVASVLFTAIIVISLCLISTVRNVTVEYACSTEQTEREVISAKTRLEEYLGKNILAVDEGAVSTFLSDNPYVEVVSVKVKFPAVLTVSVVERQESFAVRNGDKYFFLTKDCFVLSEKAENTARADGKALTLIDGDTFDLTVNEKAEITDVLLSTAIKIINGFSDLRNELVSVTIDRNNEQSESTLNTWNRIYVQTGEGAHFTIYQADELSEEKITILHSVFSSMTGEDRVSGKYVIYTAENNTADYERI